MVAGEGEGEDKEEDAEIEEVTGKGDDVEAIDEEGKEKRVEEGGEGSGNCEDSSENSVEPS